MNVSTDFLLGRSDDIGTSAGVSAAEHLDRLNVYDLDIAEKPIEALAREEGDTAS
jgi:hypothetical protein